MEKLYLHHDREGQEISGKYSHCSLKFLADHSRIHRGISSQSFWSMVPVINYPRLVTSLAGLHDGESGLGLLALSRLDFGRCRDECQMNFKESPDNPDTNLVMKPANEESGPSFSNVGALRRVVTCTQISPEGFAEHPHQNQK